MQRERMQKILERIPVVRHLTKPPLSELIPDEKEMVVRFSKNATVLKIMLGSIRMGFKIASLPLIREFHPWVDERKTHGVMLPINEELKYDNVLLPYPIITEFIEKSSHRMIMNVCGCRQAYGCKNHPATLGCINMGESVLDINPGLGRLVSKEEAHAHVRKAIESGLVPHIGKGRIDNTLYGIPDKGKLMGLCFCCHCCCIAGFFKTLPADQLDRMFPRIEGVRMEVTDACTGCGTCLTYCIYDGMKVENGKARVTQKCRLCGRCAMNCPSGAITMSLDNHAFKDEIIRRISAYVDLT